MSGNCRVEKSDDALESRGVEWLHCALGLEKGKTPFPWQVVLLRRFLAGEPVSALDIPTGLGKTATMAVWLVARALGAAVPRRLIYVVDRRAVVDQATEVAESLRAWVETEPPVAAGLGLGHRPLPISTLRGQHVDNREWLEDPSSPAIVVGTVDMIGSRLLFEGYRCSRKLRPYHAALIGADALIVLDEAHLVPAFEAMVRAAAEDETLKAHPRLRELVPASRVMSLSATGRQTARTLQLSAADRAHTVVKRRLGARKRLRVAPAVKGDLLPAALASKAWELTSGGSCPSRVVVFADSRETAQAVNDLMEKLAKGDDSRSAVAIETELFVGGRRVAEREGAAKRLVDLGFVAGSNKKPDKPVFLVATSAGEVGVDLDADHAVLDLVEWERMVQRLGRVNRRGDGEAEVWVLPSSLDDKTKEALEKEERIRGQGESEGAQTDEEEGEEDDAEDNKAPKRLKDEERQRVDRWRRREATERAIRSLPLSDGAYDASPLALTELRRAKAAFVEAGSTPPPLHPALTRAVLEAWSMTSLEEHTGRPNVRPWLRGWVEEDAQTAVVWRTWLPRKRDAKSFFEAAAIETAETLEMESKIVHDWLQKRVKRIAKLGEAASGAQKSEEDSEPDAADAESGRAPLRADDAAIFVLDERHRGWTLAELSALDKRGRDDLLRDISGETIVIDARLGGLSDSGLLDAKSDAASDVSESAEAALPFRVREVETLESPGSDDDWRLEDTFISRVDDEGEPIAWLVVETNPRQQSTTAEGRSIGCEQALAEHQAFAERHARRIGGQVGLRPEHVDLLALAAALHDEGKKAERWQRAFRAPRDKRPLGKTTSRPIQSILAGYRHELGSLTWADGDPRVASLSPEDRDLVLHMIAAHHGFARPLLRTDGCDDAPPSALVERARSVALRFARLEKRWGPWGLAWWETLLRAADQGASRENDERGGARG